MFPPSADVQSADSLSLSAQRDDHRVRVVVCVADLHVFKDVSVLCVFVLLLQPLQANHHNLNLCITIFRLPSLSTGGQAAGFLCGHCPGERQDGLDHAGLGREPGFQGETPLALTTWFNVNSPGTECTVCVQPLHVCDSAVTLN